MTNKRDRSILFATERWMDHARWQGRSELNTGTLRVQEFKDNRNLHPGTNAGHKKNIQSPGQVVNMNIREMSKEDIEDFVILAKQLGYEAEKSHLNECINNRGEDEIVFVAEKSGTVIGWINSKINQSYLSKPYCEIAGFVVDENERSRGTGKNLIRKVEIWAKDKGVHNIIVHSNIKRERAHNFYKVNGYNLIKKSKMFKKEL